MGVYIERHIITQDSEEIILQPINEGIKVIIPEDNREFEFDLTYEEAIELAVQINGFVIDLLKHKIKDEKD